MWCPALVRVSARVPIRSLSAECSTLSPRTEPTLLQRSSTPTPQPKHLLRSPLPVYNAQPNAHPPRGHVGWALGLVTLKPSPLQPILANIGW